MSRHLAAGPPDGPHDRTPDGTAGRTPDGTHDGTAGGAPGGVGGVAARVVRWLVTGWVRPGWLVPLQGAAMVGHALPGGPGVSPPAAVRALGAVGVVAGTAVSMVAALDLGAELTPAVTPRPGARLRTDGVYGLSRHPLYAGLLVASAGAVLLRGRASTLVSAAGLAAVLHVKAVEEDRQLAVRFGEGYEQYRRRVPRLVGVPRRA